MMSAYRQGKLEKHFLITVGKKRGICWNTLYDANYEALTTYLAQTTECIARDARSCSCMLVLNRGGEW